MVTIAEAPNIRLPDWELRFGENGVAGIRVAMLAIRSALLFAPIRLIAERGECAP